ncbi:MAG: hypothetical protein CR988_04100 [Treponema sp.]|nr:MAG: hypothetical protein CR988_04100 [Treponema sp.]
MKKEFKLQFFLVFLILILLILLSEKLNKKIDMSNNKIYSISNYTNELFNSLDDCASITWFKSKNAIKLLPQLDYLNAILNEYSKKENCNFNIVETEDLSENAIIKLGLIPEQIQTGTRDKQIIENIYSSLMIEYKDEAKLIPFVFEINNLEYTIANTMSNLIQDSIGLTLERQVYIIAQKEVFNTQYKYVLPFLEYAGYIPVLIPSNTKDSLNEINSLNTEYPLIVIGSENISKTLLQKINNFLQNSGNACFFVSGMKIDLNGNWVAEPKSDDLIELLASYGFYIGRDLLLDIFNFNLQMNSKDGLTSEIINYPFWIRINRPQIDKDQPLFAAYKTLQTFWPSSLITDNTIDKTLKPIIHTSNQSTKMIENFNTDPFLIDNNSYAGLKPEKNIIAAISKKRGKIFVMSDEYFISTAIEYAGADYNLTFMVNIVEWLSDKTQLLKLKNKQTAIMPFKSFENKNEYTKIIIYARILNFILIPAVILSVILILKIKERKQKNVQNPH